MELWIGAVNLGLLYAFMAMGVYVSFRIFDFPDITVDGSLTMGAAVGAVLLVAGMHPLAVLPAALGAGVLAGLATALIHTKLKVNGLLAGILVMTGLYSINLRIMGRANIPLLKEETFFTWLARLNPGLPDELWVLLALLGIMGLFCLLVTWFLHTDLGITVRATGDNPAMVSASGVDVDRMKLFGIALSNGLVALSGALVAQYQGFVDIGMGIGVIVFGLASVTIGESVLRSRTLWVVVLGVVMGSVVFRLMVALALSVGLNPIDLKLITALFVLGTLVLSHRVSLVPLFRSRRRLALGASVLAVGALVLLGVRFFEKDVQLPIQKSPEDKATGSLQSGRYHIGIVQIVDHQVLNDTREAFVAEMEELGFVEGTNTRFDLANAHGDIATLPTILDSFVQNDVDLVLTISTPATQAAITRIKDRSIIFATVANPFVIDAGTDDESHLPNVTGVYGSVPMDQFMEMSTAIRPDLRRIGVMWNEGQANAVYNVTDLRRILASDYPEIRMEEGIVSNSAEVYDQALALAGRDIDAFVLPPDNTVFSAMEAVEKAANQFDIPIFLAELARLKDGIVGAVGYDYRSSGIQAAHLAQRILGEGEDPGDIPFQRYTGLYWGVNLDKAAELGVEIPRKVIERAELVVQNGKEEDGRRLTRIGIVQFAMEPNVEKAKQGLVDALGDKGFFAGKNIELIYRNANADFPTITSIMQELGSRGTDIILPLSTPVVQGALQLARNHPKQRVVFAYIFDPYRIGVAETPERHQPNMTGVACFPPIEGMLDLIQEMVPERRKIGVVWNSSEANSESVLSKARPYAEKLGLTLMEATVSGSAEVLEASKSLAARGAEVFLNPGDNTLNVSYDSFAQVAADNRIPVFSIDPDFIENKTLAALGPSYYRTGYEGGEVLARVLEGESTADIPIGQTSATELLINRDEARRLAIELPTAILKGAGRIVPEE
jgi:putative ABC transport system permease protein